MIWLIAILSLYTTVSHCANGILLVLYSGIFILILYSSAEKPKLMPLMDKTETVLNLSHVIFCNLLSGTPPIEFRWWKNGNLLRETKNLKFENKATFSLLKIGHLQRNDSGLYSCDAANRFGRDVTTNKLFILGMSLDSFCLFCSQIRKGFFSSFGSFGIFFI